MKRLEFILLIMFVWALIMSELKSQTLFHGVSNDLVENLIADSVITNVEYIKFDTYIHDSKFDTLLNTLLVELRPLKKDSLYLKKDGKIVLYDLEKNEIRWSHNVDFNKSFVDFRNGLIITVKSNKSQAIDVNTGYIKWIIKGSFFYVSFKHGIALAYDNKVKNASKIVRAYNTKTARPLWLANVDKRYGWRGLSMANDSTMIIDASGINSVDIKRGLKWKYETKIVKKTKGYGPRMGHALNQNSNALVSDSTIYYATESILYRIDSEGKFVWKTNLPEGVTGTSVLMNQTDSTFIMVNMGYIQQGANPFRKFGKPYVAQVHKDDGEINYLSYVEGLKKIKRTWVSDNIYLSDNNELVLYDSQSGKFKNQFSINRDFRKFRGGLKDSVYFYREDKRQMTQIRNDDNYMWLISEDFEAYKVNKDGIVFSDLSPNDLYLVKIDEPNFKIFSSTESSIIFDKKEIALFKIRGTNPKMIKDKIYFSSGSKLFSLAINSIELASGV